MKETQYSSYFSSSLMLQDSSTAEIVQNSLLPSIDIAVMFLHSIQNQNSVNTYPCRFLVAKDVSVHQIQSF